MQVGSHLFILLRIDISIFFITSEVCESAHKITKKDHPGLQIQVNFLIEVQQIASWIVIEAT